MGRGGAVRGRFTSSRGCKVLRLLWGRGVKGGKGGEHSL